MGGHSRGGRWEGGPEAAGRSLLRVPSALLPGRPGPAPASDWRGPPPAVDGVGRPPASSPYRPAPGRPCAPPGPQPAAFGVALPSAVPVAVLRPPSPVAVARRQLRGGYPPVPAPVGPRAHWFAGHRVPLTAAPRGLPFAALCGAPRRAARLASSAYPLAAFRQSAPDARPAAGFRDVRGPAPPVARLHDLAPLRYRVAPAAATGRARLRVADDVAGSSPAHGAHCGDVRRP